MAHNFAWSSVGMEGLPKALYCGIEFVDGMIKSFSQNPDRDEYLMGETKANSTLDPTTVTSDWFKVTISTSDKGTLLTVIVADPTIYADGKVPSDDDFESSSNLQILSDGSHAELDMKIHKDLIDAELFEMLHSR